MEKRCGKGGPQRGGPPCIPPCECSAYNAEILIRFRIAVRAPASLALLRWEMQVIVFTAAHGVAARKSTDNGCTRQPNCAPSHVGTSPLLKMGGLPRGTHWRVPLERTLSFVGAFRKHASGMFLASDRSGYAARRELRSFCTSRKKWHPRRETQPRREHPAATLGTTKKARRDRRAYFFIPNQIARVTLPLRRQRVHA